MDKVYVYMCVCHCCPIQCLNTILSHHTISAPMTVAVKALEEWFADLQLTEMLNLQTTLSLHLKVQTTYSGSGLSKQMNCWRVRRRRVERRAPVLLSGSDVQFGCSWCVLKEFKLCFYSLPVGRSSHFLFMPHSEKKTQENHVCSFSDTAKL